MTPPKHENFEAKKLFGATGQIIDGAIAYMHLKTVAVLPSLTLMSTTIFLLWSKVRPGLKSAIEK